MNSASRGILGPLNRMALLATAWALLTAQAHAQAPKPVHYDAIVVGAGYGGLISAAILAKKGLKTLVVEEMDQIGGRLGAANYKGYWLDWGARGGKDFGDNFVVVNKRGQYGRKAAAEAGAEIAWVGPIKPLVTMHRMKDGKVVPINADAEGSAKFATEALDLTPEQATRFLTIMKNLAAEDPAKWMNVSLAEWLATIEDKALHEAFVKISMIHLADPLEESSVGRWIAMLRDPQEVFKIDDREVGNLQGIAEAYARVIRKHGGEIKLGRETMEVSVDGDKITGVVVRDKINMVEEFAAPVVVFALPVWEALKVMDESRFPPDVVKNAHAQELGYRGDLVVLNIGIKRLPTVRATGKPESYIGFHQFVEETTGWYTPSLSSKKGAPPGKHLLSVITSNGKNLPFSEAKRRLEKTKAHMRQYYSDLDAVIEWERYQLPRMWATSAYWKMAALSPLEVPGIDGLYFTGTTVNVEGMFQDKDANSALQATALIMQRRAQAK